MKYTLPLTMTLLTLASLVACNDSSTVNDQSKTNGGNPVEMISADGSNVEGFYAGNIFPINHNLHFKKLGMIGVTRSGDEFNVKIRMENAPRNAQIRHSLYSSTRCPTMQDDLNKDAFIDIREARIALGEIVIPFDGDLSSQKAGLATTQVSDLSGNYVYSRSTSFDLMFSDLKAQDSILPSYMRKLNDGEGLGLAGKVVLFQGVSPQVTLPKTVQDGSDGMALHDSIPFGCAILWKVPSAPEELNTL